MTKKNSEIVDGTLPEDRSPESGDEPVEKVPETEIDLQRQLEEQTELAEGYLAQLKRVQADFENYQKRIEQERERIIISANEVLISDLLETVDNFERALDPLAEHSPEDARGMRMIYDGMVKLLEDNGLEKIEALDCQFDPYKHEAVMQVETDDARDNTILEEFQKGYSFRSKVIRPSKVKVAKAIVVENEKDKINQGKEE